MLKLIHYSSARQFHSQVSSPSLLAKSSGFHWLQALGSIAGLGCRGSGECSVYRRAFSCSGSSSDDEAVEGEVESGESEARSRDATVPTNPYLTVLALPLPHRPLFPGFYMPIYVKDPKLLAALQENRKRQPPYFGAFLLKDEPGTDPSVVTSSETEKIIYDLKGKELFDHLNEVGTLAQISSIQGDQVILFGHTRLRITEIVSEDPLSEKVNHHKEKLFNKYDDVIKATSFEVISTLRDALKTSSPWRDHVQPYTNQQVGDFNFPRLADFGAAIFGANKSNKKGFTKGFPSSSQPLKNPHSNLRFNDNFQLKLISSSSARQFHSQFSSPYLRAKSSGSANNNWLQALGSIAGLGRQGLGECRFYRRAIFWSGSSSDDESVEAEVKSGKLEVGSRDSGNAIAPTNPRPGDYLTILALPLLERPLFPGLHMPIYVKDHKLLAALQENHKRQAPYFGAFLLKDEPGTDPSVTTSSETEKIIYDLKGKELFDRLHEVGTLAQISSIQGDQVILIGHILLRITEMVSEDPLTVKVDPLEEKPFNRYDDVIKALSFEVISTLRDALKTSTIWRFHVQTYTQQFDFPRLADFGAAISDANKLQCQEVLEELDVHKRLSLTLELVKREVEISKIQESLQISTTSHEALWSVTDPREFHIFSEKQVASKDFKYFDLNTAQKTRDKMHKDWVDYSDGNQVAFRGACYKCPPEGYVSVHSDGSVKDDLIVYGLETIAEISNGSAAAVKRSDKGALLNSCAMKLGFVDILTAEAEGAYLGFLLSSDDEKVQMCMDSFDLLDLLRDYQNVPPKECEDLIFEMRSMIDIKVANGGVIELKKVDRIGNYLVDRMTQLPNYEGWPNPPKAPIYFHHPKDFPTEQLRTILAEDMEGCYRYAKKRKQ